MSAHAVDVTVKDFQTQVIDASKKAPVLVDFWAPWCGPCRALGPVLEKLAAEYGGRFILAKVNSDENQSLARQYGVRGIPNVKAFANGELADEFTGALPETQVREFIDRLLPSPAEPLRQQALAAKARGETDATRKLLLQAITLDPRHEAARLDLVDLMIDAKDIEEARRLLDEIADRARDAVRVDALRARLQLVANSGSGADRASLERKIAADPADLEAHFELANLLALHQDYGPAMEQLLEIVRRERGFRDDAARKTLINLFNLLGSDNALVREYRSRLAAALN
ncbi:MAG: thioredoxin [Proteobacteria bacterium]|jgi:putative thioredoxin|nr:thioredoxin [Pseudomonadota bacterium]